MQWNCYGARGSWEELQLLTKDSQPQCLCLQETFLGADGHLHLRNYSAIYSPANFTQGPSGGTCPFISNNVAHTPLSLNTPLQATAAQNHITSTYPVCSLYLPSFSPFSLLLVNFYFLSLSLFSYFSPILFTPTYISSVFNTIPS